MTRPIPGPAAPPPAAAALDAGHIAALILADDLDAALEAGLMEFVDDPALAPPARALILATQRRLREAWDARERYRAREARPARRKAARDTRRGPATAALAGTPALPPAAAAALARAKARAGSS
ncbi:hypothetical protein [Luteimonas sp. A482]